MPEAGIEFLIGLALEKIDDVQIRPVGQFPPSEFSHRDDGEGAGLLRKSLFRLLDRDFVTSPQNRFGERSQFLKKGGQGGFSRKIPPADRLLLPLSKLSENIEFFLEIRLA